MKTKYIIGIGVAVFIMSAVVVSYVNADNQPKYRFMGENAPPRLIVTGGATITQITAIERAASGLYFDEYGNPMRYLSVYYTVSYSDASPEIFYDQFIISFDPVDAAANNLIKKEAIERHAYDKWGWNITRQEYGYNKITQGNQ